MRNIVNSTKRKLVAGAAAVAMVGGLGVLGLASPADAFIASQTCGDNQFAVFEFADSGTLGAKQLQATGGNPSLSAFNTDDGKTTSGVKNGTTTILSTTSSVVHQYCRR